MVVAGILSGLEVALPLVQGLLPIPTGLFAALSGITVAGAYVARIVAQEKLHDD